MQNQEGVEIKLEQPAQEENQVNPVPVSNVENQPEQQPQP